MDERKEIPMQQRLAQLSSVNVEQRTAELLWSTGAQVRRMDFWTGKRYVEELSLDPSHVDLSRMNTGAPLLNTHARYDLNDVIGVVEPGTTTVANGEARSIVRFSKRADVEPIFQDVRDGIVRNVSVGYTVRKFEITEEEGQDPIYRAIDWQPGELSLVPMGADAGAGVRSEQQRTSACEFIRSTPSAAADTTTERETMPAAAAVNEGTAAPTPAVDQEAIRREATAAERARVAEITTIGTKFKQPAVAARCIAAGDDVVKARDAIWEAAVAATEGDRTKDTRSARFEETGDDVRQLRRDHMADALLHRMNPASKITDGARQYRHMSLLRMAEDCISAEGVNVRGMDRMQIAARALHTTSDFPSLTANVLNKRLRQAYEENQPSYRMWARRAPNAPDFKAIQATVLANAPDLAALNEDGEFTYGTLSDGKETYTVTTYGKIVGVTRQLLINDDLRGLERLVSSFGNAAARLENRTVYGILTTNAALSDTVALFHATHGNLTGSGTAISIASLGVGRAAMRLQKGLQSEELNIVPNYLIVPATQEQLAYQFTSSNFVPTKNADVNEFRNGGRTAVEVVVESVLDATSTTAWYLAASNGTIDTVEYCYLDGYEGVFLDNEIGFDIDGMKVKARLDFAAKAIDYRGLYKNVGA